MFKIIKVNILCIVSDVDKETCGKFEMNIHAPSNHEEM